MPGLVHQILLPQGSSQTPSEAVASPDYESMSTEPSLRDFEGSNEHGEPPTYSGSQDDLKTRGKGRYTCPQGMTCSKGGVHNGELRVFTRNSEFR